MCDTSLPGFYSVLVFGQLVWHGYAMGPNDAMIQSMRYDGKAYCNSKIVL